MVAYCHRMPARFAEAGFLLPGGQEMADQADIENICSQLAAGKSLRAICREMGVAESTVRYWLIRDEQAFAQSAHARELGCDALADECLEIADDTTGKPEDRRIRIDTRLRLIGKWSQRYSDKLTVKSEKTVTHKYDLDGLPTEQLEQLEGILANAQRDQGGAGETIPPAVH
jgi:hypothetical protein